ncbi:DUF6305 family protein [Alsobacter sp. SYSU M60028]|uniref:DUF6305 family protein n=1 Tax=Alsobacter ponti TaxID=2962936 RepID=A0ABT1L6A0_9HYPH|nr:DUF6305 family protein [Alsobacter ponti]MCP8936914.1 DUF6305 family protein [Alsobacter ponti]
MIKWSVARLFTLTALAAVVSFLVSPPREAFSQTKASPPAVVTSLGQSLDAFQVQLAVKRSGIPYKYDAHIEANQLGDAKTLILAVGASLKGFGDAGISINDELARTSHLLDAAKSKGMTIVVVHIGGEERRDALSNQLIELAAPRAQYLIIRNDSDADGIFTKIAKAGNIPVVVVENAAGLKAPLEKLFAGS